MTRAELVAHRNTLFQRDSQRYDLLDPTKTKQCLIDSLSTLVEKGHFIEFTCIQSDHHDDSALGEHCHRNGYCADVWFNSIDRIGSYLDADSHAFALAVKDVSELPRLHQVGLAGSAQIARLRDQAGDKQFDDGGADHIHLGTED